MPIDSALKQRLKFSVPNTLLETCPILLPAVNGFKSITVSIYPMDNELKGPSR